MGRIIWLVALLAAAPSRAADWRYVAPDKGARVEFDRASLLPSDPGKKVVWVRLVLPPKEAAREGYQSLKSLNRYDCRAWRYSTVKRVYLREDMSVMREERVEGERESAIRSGTIEARLFREVCRPPTTSELKELALQAAEAAEMAAGSDRKDGKAAGRESKRAAEARKPVE